MNQLKEVMRRHPVVSLSAAEPRPGVKAAGLALWKQFLSALVRGLAVWVV